MGCPRPVDGESLAIYYGLCMARDKGWSKVMIESDCLQVINCLSTDSVSFGAIVESCLAFRSFFQQVPLVLFVVWVTR